MKKVAIIAIALVFTASAFAQKRNEFKGPAYKNYKPWQHDVEPTVVYTVVEKENLTGPEYKNQKVWEKDNTEAYKVITIGTKRSKLKGPAYKNYKAWMHKEQENKDS
ncbi:hypothetical protein PK35_04915 [Tamlana nanhaiensis]|uniref:Uncharacterized protein n=1 Tax=Neotamlana nanhaiensis TaxID=1382798 RepID=A0A0D7W4V1_9FLAO|nr:hypothetical protein [Tamlana nanhaiensis]KJD34074.1 hypothetical protein PK35_04915 [Tamlana nanhaiensis]